VSVQPPEVATAVLAVQMTEVIKDVADLRSELRDHRQEHKDEATARSAARWKLVVVMLTLFAAIEGPLLTLVLTRR